MVKVELSQPEPEEQREPEEQPEQEERPEQEEQQEQEEQREQEERPGENEPEKGGSAARLRKILLPVAVGVTAVVAVPVVVGALGFGAGGIAAGSLAAKGMSLAATTGYGMPVVSCLQSVGAAGMTLSQGATVGSAAAALASGTRAIAGRLFGRG